LWSAVPFVAFCGCARVAVLHVAAERRAQPLLSRPSPQTAVLLLGEGELVLTDFTPETPRAISEALALAPIVAPARQRDDTGIGADIHLLELQILAEAVSTASRCLYRLVSTACRAAGVTSARSFFTDFTALDPCRDVTGGALGWAGIDLAAEVDDALAVSTLIWVPFTRSSRRARSGLGGSQLSLTIVLAACVVVWAFSVAAPLPAGPRR